MPDRTPNSPTADLVDRLVRLREVLPLMASDLAAARRRSTALEHENQRLQARVRELESRLAAARRATPGAPTAPHAPSPRRRGPRTTAVRG